jgi:hypothetical protein
MLLAAVCLGLTGCATIKSWFAPDTPPAQAERPEESAPRGARQPAPSAPRATPPAPGAPRPPAPGAPTPALGAPRPPAPGAPTPAPDAPPPVLSPVLSAVDEQKLRADTQQRIDGAEQRLRQVDPGKLPSGQHESLQTAQSFLDKAREALQAQDVQRAFTLADKAYLLADELSKHPR